MRSTLILEVDDQLAEFIQNQAGTVDPSALVNKLLREAMRREGAEPGRRNAADNDAVKVAMEEFLDENTHAAG